MWLSQNSEIRTAFEQELKAYESQYQKELDFRDSMLRLLAYENCFERSLLHAHFTASAWVVNKEKTKALFTHHAKLNRWLQLGGHADDDENLREVALTECREESGLTSVSLLSQDIFDLDIHTIPERKGVPEHDHYDVRFLFQAPENDLLTVSNESIDVAWIPFENIGKQTEGNESIQRMLNKTLQMSFS